MLLLHPGVAKIDCNDCIKRLYDLEKGEPKFYRAGPDREKKYYDGPTHKPPCRLDENYGGGCPKGSPETAWQCTLSSENLEALELFDRCQANPHYMNDAEKSDAFLADVFHIIKETRAAAIRKQQAEEFAAALAPFIVAR